MLMVYTEVKERNEKKYFYRVRSIRNKNKVSKKRIYLGVNLTKRELYIQEQKADKTLNFNIKRNNNIEKLKSIIIKTLKKNNIKKAGIFGSYARGEQRKDSDIDILAEIPKKISLFQVVGIKLELEDALKKKVDLVEYKLIRSEIKKIILNEEVRII